MAEFEVKGIKKTLSYGEADFEIDVDPGKTKESWESIGKAKKVIADLSTFSGIEITPRDLMLNPEGVTKIVKMAYPNAQGWRVKPIELPESREVIVECKNDGDSNICKVREGGKKWENSD